MNIDEVREREEGEEGSKGWIYLWLFALSFLLYGLFMFVVVGDKGPPDWDFGAAEDTPGKSVYSTYPEPDGGTAEVPGQHVNGEPGEGIKKVEGK
jgi:hypothetical protein